MRLDRITQIGLLLAALGVLLSGSLVSADTPAVLIREVAWSGNPNDSNGEWIELHNTTASAIDLSGWTLSAADGTPSITLSGSIPAFSEFLLERGEDATDTPADIVYTGALENGGEVLTLYDDSAAIIDSLDASDGWPAGDAGLRVPMVFNVDTGDWESNPRCGTPTNSVGSTHNCDPEFVMLDTAPAIQTFFNTRYLTATATTTQTTMMEDALISAIDGAQFSIVASLYGLNRQSVIDALVAAHGRGVSVQVVTDDEAYSGSYADGYTELEDAGIVVRDDEHADIHHNKFLVIDNNRVWTGSTNLTDTGFTLNANNSLLIDSPELAADYAEKFNAMWDGQFHSDRPFTIGTTYGITKTYSGTWGETWDYLAQYTAYFAPEDALPFVVAELLRAGVYVDTAMFYLTDGDIIGQAILDNAREVDMYDFSMNLVMDELGAASPHTIHDDLAGEYNINVCVEENPGKLHHKFALIQTAGEAGPRWWVITGSYNWTHSGGWDNDENIIVALDNDLYSAYQERFWDLWQDCEAAQPTPTPMPTITPRPTEAPPTPTPAPTTNPPPSYVLTPTMNIETPVAVDFPTEYENTSTTDAPGGLEFTVWEFGDGNTSTDLNATHTYTQAGEYEVRLTTGDSYNRATINQTVTVTAFQAFIPLVMNNHESTGSDYNYGPPPHIRVPVIDVEYTDGSESVTIQNLTHDTVNLHNWQLIDEQGYAFFFPDYDLAPDEILNVRVGQVYCTLCWYSHYPLLSTGEIVQLVTANGKLVSWYP